MRTRCYVGLHLCLCSTTSLSLGGLVGSSIRTGSLPFFLGTKVPKGFDGSQPSFLRSRICFEGEGLGSPWRGD